MGRTDGVVVGASVSQHLTAQAERSQPSRQPSDAARTAHVAGASCSPRAATNAGSWSWTHHGDGAVVGVTVGAAVTARVLPQPGPQHVALQMRRTSSPEQSSSCCALAHRSGLPVSTSSAPAFTSWVLHHSAVVTGLAVGSADGMSVGAEVGAELGSDVAGPHRVRTPWQYELAGSPEQSSVGLGVGNGFFHIKVCVVGGHVYGSLRSQRRLV